MYDSSFFWHTKYSVHFATGFKRNSEIPKPCHNMSNTVTSKLVYVLHTVEYLNHKYRHYIYYFAFHIIMNANLIINKD